MKRIVTMFILISVTITGLFLANQTLLLAKPSATATETMRTANQLYEAGRFAQAAQGYQQLVDQGFADSNLFYNLGNAHFKQGDYGRAILNFRRAEQLAPRDADIETNLNLARAQIVDQLEQIESGEGFVSRLARFTQEWLTLNELAMATLSVWVLFAFLVIAFGSSKKGGALRESLQYGIIVTSLVLTVGLVGLGSRLYVGNSHSEGVIVASEIDVVSGPGSQYVTEFTLHSGTEVSLVESRASWVRLALPDDELQGWVPATAVEAVAEQS